ncbi:Signal transduction histidine kinase [Streptomyces sp. MnatMP-M77]|uniref:sensor histidine kinase n=1 Tax=unclassified Streptomyces TaxID=2593676 RepID=UPI000805B0C6|nr:HAMP domain-containing sensor histidine kinase [Streptomyces sp. MnatMP-M77]MYT82084.1 sensor histidine kinase [Streptomyces sp. SID8364]SBV07584.1 Signal transduction histidine kinase [Streptomyces sp. MnatMP-M77]
MAAPVPRRRSPARRRLHRLRLRLTAAYTLITVVGLACLSWLVIRTDDRARMDAEYDEMRRRASVAASLVYYEDDRIRLDGLADDEATSGTPQVLVVERRPGGGPVTVFRGRTAQFAVAAGTVREVARSAMDEEGPVRTGARDRTGEPVRLLAVPFYHDATDEVAGAAVAVGDPERGAAEHRSLVLSLVIGAGALTALAALTGHVLSGRSLRPAWEALEQQERLLADAAHELRTPVAVMRGSVEVAAGAPGGLEGQLPRIRRAADRMADVVENLLTRGRLEAAADVVRAEPLRLDQLVEEVCAELPEGGPGLESRLEESVVEADAALVRVAVRNLLDNAVRHGRVPGVTPDGAELLVTVCGPEVRVADRGPGVAPARLPELTERFSSPGGGTGIGLSLVRRIAEAHRGSLSVRARPGGGAEFALRLAPARSRPGAGRTLTIRS